MEKLESLGVDENEPLLKTTGPIAIRNKRGLSFEGAEDQPDEEEVVVTFLDRVFSLIKLSIPVTIAGSWSFAFNFLMPRSVWMDLAHAFAQTLLVLFALKFITSHPDHDDFDSTIGKFYKLGGMTFGMMVSWAWTGFLEETSVTFISHQKHAQLMDYDRYTRLLGWRVLFAVITVAFTYCVSVKAAKVIILGKKSFSLVMWVLLETALICPVAWALNDVFRFIALHNGKTVPTLWTKAAINLVICPLLLQLMSMDIAKLCGRTRIATKASQVQSAQRKHFWRSVMGAIVAWAILDACDASLESLKKDYSLTIYVLLNVCHTALFTVIAISFAWVSGKFEFDQEEGLKIYTFETVTMTIGMSFGWSWRDLNKNILMAVLKPTMYGGYAKLLPVASAICTTALGVYILLLLVPNHNDEWGSSSSFSEDSEDEEEGIVDTAQLRPEHAKKHHSHHHYHHRSHIMPIKHTRKSHSQFKLDVSDENGDQHHATSVHSHHHRASTTRLLDSSETW